MSYAADRRKEFFVLIESYESARKRGLNPNERKLIPTYIANLRASNRSASKVLPG